MVAQVIDFSKYSSWRQKRDCNREVARQSEPKADDREFMFWSGASGRLYVHSIYTLIDCPELPNANVVFVRNCSANSRQQIQVSRVENGASSLNLAEIRHKGALLGADEVHVHLLGKDRSERLCIEYDLVSSEVTPPLSNRAMH